MGPRPGPGTRALPTLGRKPQQKHALKKYVFLMNICLECDSKHVFRKVDKQTKPLC